MTAPQRRHPHRNVVPKVAVVGAGWSGAVAARQLHDAGCRVDVYETQPHVGGHARTEVLNGIVYEPNGAHIFHTSNAAVARYVRRFGMRRPYQHCVLTEVFLDDDDDTPYLLSWPPQIDELSRLPLWPGIERELADLPPSPGGDDFESFVISMMGPTLYRLFIRDYTIKQWGMEPAQLSSSVAPKRVELRNDGNRRLFRDRWEFFPARGINSIIESILRPVRVTCGASLTVDDIGDLGADAVVVTAPLDDFGGSPGELAWRGIAMRSTFHPTADPAETVTPAYVVNRPSLRIAYTRTVETKHATGQRSAGTVVSEEYPGSPDRHYPIPTVGRLYEQANEALKQRIRSTVATPVFFCGRLANYSYINQDQAIEQAFACADEVIQALA